jgi:hypothetical protein
MLRENTPFTLLGLFSHLREDDAAVPHYCGPFIVYLMGRAELWRQASKAFGKRTGYN